MSSNHPYIYPSQPRARPTFAAVVTPSWAVNQLCHLLALENNVSKALGMFSVLDDVSCILDMLARLWCLESECYF